MSETKEFMLTTIDNPFDPFTQFNDWFAFDEQQGYHSCSLLARVCKSSYALSDEEDSEAINQAIDEIVNENVSGMHIKVSNETR